MNAMEILMMIGMGLGYVGGTYLALHFSRRWLATVIVKMGLNAKQTFGVQLAAIIAGLLGLLPAFFYATVIGGTLGGGLGEIAFGWFGLERIGVPVGLAFGLTVVISTLIILAVAVGAGLAMLGIVLFQSKRH